MAQASNEAVTRPKRLVLCILVDVCVLAGGDLTGSEETIWFGWKTVGSCR